MYKCKNCGHLFDDGEQKHVVEKHGFSDGMYEEYDSCPVCGASDFEETKRCLSCGGEFLKGELIDDKFCYQCLIEDADPDTFLSFLDAEKPASDKIGWLEDFVYYSILCVETPKYGSFESKQICRDLYLRAVASDKINRCNKTKEMIENFFLVADGLEEDFAEYLVKTRDAK